MTGPAFPVRGVMVFAEQPDLACRWWAEHLGGNADVHLDGSLAWFDVAGVEFGFHPADPAANPVGGSPVVYLATLDLEASRAALLAAGCRSHRGPLDVGAGRRICQLVDPFGNTFGLDGP